MKKQINALKLTFLGTAVAALGIGCASSGYARYDADQQDMSAGASANTEMGSGHQTDLASDEDRAAASSTVSALGRTVETRATWVNKFPFYDRRIRTLETYTFAVPDPSLSVASTDANLPEFSASLEPGSVFVEAAGGSGEVRTGRVIRHSANPMR